MKRFLAAILASGFILTTYGATVKPATVYANEGEKAIADMKKNQVKVSGKDEKKAAEYQKYAEEFETKAVEAEKSGNKILADVYKRCAATKRKMSTAYSSGDKKLLAEAGDEWNKLMAEVNNARNGKSASKK